MKELDEFRKKTGIADPPIDLWMRQNEEYAPHPEQGLIINDYTLWTVDDLKGESEQRPWCQAVFWDEGAPASRENIYDSTWRPAPEALPEHENDDEET